MYGSVAFDMVMYGGEHQDLYSPIPETDTTSASNYMLWDGDTVFVLANEYKTKPPRVLAAKAN